MLVTLAREQFKEPDADERNLKTIIVTRIICILVTEKEAQRSGAESQLQLLPQRCGEKRNHIEEKNWV